MFVFDGAKIAKNLVEDTGKGLISTLSFGRRDRSLHKTHKKLPIVKLEIVSDTVCPFCYLLYNRLAAAVKQFEGKLNFEIHWVAYQLQPLAPPEGVPKAVFMEQKFKGQAEYLMKKKTAFFESQGLKYSWDGIIGNTFNSHRLVVYAGQQNLAKQTEVMGLLFKAAFVDGKYINDAQILREIAREAQLEDPDRVADDPSCCAKEMSAEHESTAYSPMEIDAITARIFIKEHILSLGVRHELETMYKDVIGVPHTVINDGQIRLGGAQDTKVFIKVFQQLLDESRMENPKS